MVIYFIERISVDRFVPGSWFSGSFLSVPGPFEGRELAGFQWTWKRKRFGRSEEHAS